jgi:ketosteroid isomerase-like protein
MTTQQVAKQFHKLAQEGAWDKIQEELFSADATSIEPTHSNGLKTVKGLDQIKEKGRQWAEMIQEVHGGYCNEPQVAGSYFTCAMGVDVTMKGQDRMKMDEIALYEVKDGKIVMEQFYY